MNLSEAKVGQSYIIEKLELSEDKKRRILDLGFTKGTKLKVINLKNNGPMIICARGTRLAMGREFSLGIMVQESGF
ncbi:MAG: ferrous iron transport protein A [Clostridia bacterium]|nr:ferrous iron transport protein A [Clostridia bacterium]